MPSNPLILCHPLLPPSVFPSLRVSSNESVLLDRWAEYWNLSFSISSSNEYSGWIYFRMDWLDHLAVQETVKSLLQHHSSKPPILWCSAFFIVQLLHPYMWKWSEVAQSCPTLCNPMGCSLPGFSVHEIFQARVPEWVAIYWESHSFD